MSADAEVHITAVESGELGESQAGLQRHEQERMVSSARPGARVGCCHQRVGLSLGEERDLACLAALLGDGEHLLDRGRVFRVAVGGEAVEGTQRGEPGVAGAPLISAASRSAKSSAAGSLPVTSVAWASRSRKVSR
jgi:hypothetical protein